MERTRKRATTSGLRCEACGQYPEPPRGKATLANVATVLPVELLVHILVLQTGLPLLSKVAILASTATALVIWVAEPSVRVALRAWLHAGDFRRLRLLNDSPALWRVRVTVMDRPGALRRITKGFERLSVNVLTVEVHRSPTGILDEFLVSAPEHLDRRDFDVILHAAGASSIHASRTTPVAVVDGQTRVLNVASRVVSDPEQLPAIIAEFLRAELVAVHTNERPDPDAVRGGTVMKIPSMRSGFFMFSRPGEPFSTAESGRAHRLAELAEIVDQLRAVTAER